MRLVTLPAFMFVIVVFVVNVFVLVIQFVVYMRQRFVVAGRPQGGCHDGEHNDRRRQHQRGGLNPDPGAELTRHGVQHEPARMRQGELG